MRTSFYTVNLTFIPLEPGLPGAPSRPELPYQQKNTPYQWKANGRQWMVGHGQ